MPRQQHHPDSGLRRRRMIGGTKYGVSPPSKAAVTPRRMNVGAKWRQGEKVPIGLLCAE